MAKKHRSSRRGDSNQDLSAGTLLAAVRKRTPGGGVVTWAELRELFRDTRRLRDVVRGLVRTGELAQDQGGNYYLPAAEGTDELARGTIVAAGAALPGRQAVRPQPDKNKSKVVDLALFQPGGDRRERQRSSLILREGDEVSYLPVTAPLVIGESAGSEEPQVRTDAQVVEVLRYSSSPLVGVVALSRFGPQVDSLSPDFRGKVALDELPGEIHEGDTVTVRVTGSDRFGLRGDITGIVARGDVADAAAISLLTSHNVPQDFPADALAIADSLPGEVQPGRFRSRLDLQGLPLVTIDGADARDFDDAVYAEASKAGGWRLVVAIADVAHYVASGAALDMAAFERGTSVYLPDRVIPMLPESLSNGLCSLRPDEPRLSLVCDMQIASSGRITSYEFHEAVICSWARLTYNQVNEYFEHATPLPIAADALAGRRPSVGGAASAAEKAAGVTGNVDELRKVYGALLAARAERGALEFETRTGVLQLANGRVEDIVEVTRNDAHRLIEEAMISANVCAAKYISSNEALGLYRVHEPPQSDKADVLRDALAYAGIRVRDLPSDPKGLAKLLEPLAGRDDAWLLYSLILRSMSQARYQPENKGHFGLALTDYMHFTSPIRRYPDLIVHRVIKALVKSRRPPMQGMDKLLQAGEHLSTAERRAEDVERGVSNWLKCDYVAGRVGETFAGVVVGVQDFGLFVELDGYFVQGLVHISSLGEEYFSYVPQSMSLVGERSGRHFGLGDRLDVVLLDVQPAQGKLDLVPEANYKRLLKSGQIGSGDAGKSGTGKGGNGKGNKGPGKPARKKGRGRRR